MGHSFKILTCSQDSFICCWTYASCIRHADGRHAERAQLNHKQYRRDRLQLACRHARTATGRQALLADDKLPRLIYFKETLELVHAGHSKTAEVAITAMDFPANETTTFWVGTEEGNIYQANRYDRAGSKAGLNQYDVYRGHAGPIMGLNFHPLVGAVDFSDLFLSCSVDWTVKLWRAKSIAKPSTSASSVAPLYSFDEADDYVYDVKWHPAHPAVFGSVDGSGKFNIWNLNNDTEVRRLIWEEHCVISY